LVVLTVVLVVVLVDKFSTNNNTIAESPPAGLFRNNSPAGELACHAISENAYHETGDLALWL